MPIATLRLKEYRINTQRIGPGNEYMQGEVHLEIQIDTRIHGKQVIPVKQVVGSDYQDRALEIGPVPDLPGSPDIPYPLIDAAIHGYVDQMIGTEGRIIGVSAEGEGEMQIESCTFAMPMTVTFEWR